MIQLIVACVTLSAAMLGPSEWLVATFDSDSRGYLPRPGLLCGEPGDETTFVLVHSSNVTTAPETVRWVENLDFDENGIIGFGDWSRAGTPTRRGAVVERWGERNDGKQVMPDGQQVVE